jgi:hypothetical protein
MCKREFERLFMNNKEKNLNYRLRDCVEVNTAAVLLFMAIYCQLQLIVVLPNNRIDCDCSHLASRGQAGLGQ